MTKPTKKANIIDLVFCNDLTLISELSVNVPFCNSDHESIHFKIYLSNDMSKPVVNQAVNIQ